MRARLAIFSAQIEYEHREVLLRDKPSTLLELSPKGTVPVLLTGSGKLIEESIDIMKWALNKNDPEKLLDIDDENDFNNFVLTIDNEFKKNLDNYKYSKKEDMDKIRSRENACKFLAGMGNFHYLVCLYVSSVWAGWAPHFRHYDCEHALLCKHSIQPSPMFLVLEWI